MVIQGRKAGEDACEEKAEITASKRSRVEILFIVWMLID